MKKRVLSWVLALAMVVTLMPSFALNAAAADGKGTFSLVCLKQKAGASATEFAFVEADKEAEYHVGDKFYVGVKMSDLSEINSIASTGFRTIGIGVNYDDDYLELEPTLGDMMKEYGMGSVKDAANVATLRAWLALGNGDETAGTPGRFYGRNDAFPYFKFGMGKSARYTFTANEKALESNDTGYENGNFRTMVFIWQTASAETAAGNQTTGDAYLLVLEFRVKAVPENGAKVLGFSHSGSNVTTAYGVKNDGTYGSVQYDKTGANSDILNVFDFDESAVDIFPAGREAVCDSGALQSGDIVYGNEVSATFTGVKEAAKTGALSYRWSTATAADATTWTPVTEWTSCTATGNEVTVKKTINKTDFGNETNPMFIRCELKGATADQVNTGAKQIQRATLTLRTDAFSAVKAPAITEGNTAAVDKEVKFSSLNNTYWTGLQSGDTVGLTFKVTYPANSAVGTPTLAGSNFTLTGNDARLYKLADSTALSVSGQVDAKSVSSLVITTQPKLDYSVKDDAAAADKTIDLSALKLTINYNNGTKDENVAYADFGAKGLTANPDNGAAVTAAMDGQKITITHTATNKFVQTNAMTVAKDDVLTKIEVKTQPTKKLNEYEDGQAFDPAGLVLTATWQTAGAKDVAYADSNITFKFKDGNALPANFTIADNGKTIVAVYQGKEVDLGTLTVAPKTSVNVTVAVTGTITKEYDNTTDVELPAGVTIDYTAPTGYTVDATDAVYTYASANVDTDIAITVTGLKFDGVETKVNVTNLADLKGNITKTTPDITLGNLSQTVGNVTEITATADPASAEAGDTLVIEYEIPGTPAVAGHECSKPDEHTEGHACSKPDEHTTEDLHDETCGWVKAVPHDDTCGYVEPVPAGDPTWETWTTAQAKLNALTAATEINVRAYVPTADTVNFNETTDVDTEATTGTLTISPAPTGGGVSGITVRYDVGEHGTLKGSASESVQRGKTPSKVPTVTAKEGYKFLGWSLDGKTVVDPTTVTITSSTTFTALYQSVKNTYISGYPDGTFRPDAQVSRAEIASMLARLSKDFDADKTYDGTASDVDANAWYSDFVNFGMNKGFISGYKDGTFQPDGKITRGEFASMLARYMGLTEGGSKQFTDTADHWAGNSIAVLADAGIVTGYNDGSFKPNANLTRAEAVQMINTALKVQALTGAADIVPTDVTSAHWAYNQILAAMNTDIKDIVK